MPLSLPLEVDRVKAVYSPEYTVSRIGYYTVSPRRACLYSPRAFSGSSVAIRVFGVSSDSSSTQAPIRIPDEVLMRQSDDRPQTDRTQKARCKGERERRA
jgi:hypothetical protein